MFRNQGKLFLIFTLLLASGIAGMGCGGFVLEQPEDAFVDSMRKNYDTFSGEYLSWAEQELADDPGALEARRTMIAEWGATISSYESSLSGSSQED